MKPLVFFNSRAEVVRREIVFPSKKKIVISRESPEYTTADKEEIDFLSKVFGIGVRALNEKEYTLYMTSRFEDMPHVEKKEISSSDLEAYLASTAHEKLVIELLRSKGYEISKKAEDFSEALSGVPEATTTKPRKTTKKK